MAEAAVTIAETPPAKMRLVITASAAGTVFEWYDFFVYGSITSIMAANFFSNLPDAQALVFSLLAFSIGLVVRPIGALVFGKIGDSVGRKGAFLITISVMGLATFAIGLLPIQSQMPESMILLPPTLLIGLRVLQGFALGGEYGGAAIYVAEHAKQNNRGSATAAIQAAAAFGLIGALFVILGVRTLVGEEAFKMWGWRVPYIVSIGLLAISVWIRLKLEESPAFQKLKDENATSRRAYAESFLEWRNLKIILLALFGLMTAQGVSWYTSHFYSQVFLERVLKVDERVVNQLLIVIVAISAPLYVFFAWLSDKIGRRPIMLVGMVLFTFTCIPGFHMLTRAANPGLEAAQAAAPAIVIADPADCTFQLDLTGGAKAFASSCDIAKGALANAGVNYTTRPGPPGALARVQIGKDVSVESISAVGRTTGEVKAAGKAFSAKLHEGLVKAGYPESAQTFNFALALGVLFVWILAATALYGPQAAALVELFPTRIRYTALSFPYNVGAGVFGGFLPPAVFAISTATGNVYSGLWFPVLITGAAALVFLFFWPETKDRDINA
jgi:hypothetical protein